MNTIPDPQRNWSQLPEGDPAWQMLFGAQLDSETTGNFTFTSEGVWVQTHEVRDMLLVTDIHDNVAIDYLDRGPNSDDDSVLGAVETIISNSRATVDQAIELHQRVRSRLRHPESASALMGAIRAYKDSNAGIYRNYNAANDAVNGVGMTKLNILATTATVLSGHMSPQSVRKTPEELSDEIMNILSTRQMPEIGYKIAPSIIQPLLIDNWGEELSMPSKLAVSEVSLHLLAARIAVAFHDLDRVTYGTSLQQQFQIPALTKKTVDILQRMVSTGCPPHTSFLIGGEADKLLFEKTDQVLRYLQRDKGRITFNHPTFRDKHSGEIVRGSHVNIEGSVRSSIIRELQASKKFHEDAPLNHEQLRTQAGYLAQMLQLEAAHTEGGVEEAAESPSPTAYESTNTQGTAEEVMVIKERCEEGLAPFNPSNKQLRKNGIVGQGSLEDKLRQMRGMNGHVEPGVKTYAGLKTMVELYGAEAQERLADLLQADAELRARYGELVNALPFAVRPKEQLPRDVAEDMQWLVAHWDEFCAAARESNHEVSDETLAAVYALLNPSAPEIEQTEPEAEGTNVLGAVALSEVPASDKSSTDVTTEWTPEELAELEQMELDDLERELAVLEAEEAHAKAADTAKKIGQETLSTLTEMREAAEQLDWVVLPPHESASVEALVRHARSVFAGTNRPAPEIKPGRMQELLDFRELLGGTLYRSEQRMLGDDNNLYFVLRFTHEGRTFALAENPIKGNATYVICEEELPLNSGETVLTAVKSLSRKDVRELGAIRIYHPQNPRISHTDKVFAAIFRLARQHESASSQL